jgi:inosine-uridine nucleoside N-ribohydrolase
LPNVAEAQGSPASRRRPIYRHARQRLSGAAGRPDAEYNVKADVEAAKRVFTAPWAMTITPLDTCGLVDLTGEKYQKVLKRNNAITSNLLQNYYTWYKDGLRSRKELDEANLSRLTNDKLNHSSTTLFDTVAIYLAVSRELVEMQQLSIRHQRRRFHLPKKGPRR